MPRINFDIDGARKAGYSDQEIVDQLGPRAGFDVESARSNQYTDAQIIDRIVDRRGAVAQSIKPQPTGAERLAKETGLGETLLVGAGRAFDRVGKGIQQAYYGATGNDEELAALKQRAESDDAVYDPLRKQRPIATAIGEALPTAVIPVGTAATAVGTAGKLAASGAVPGLLGYGTAGERLTSGATGAIGSVVGGQVIPAAARAVVETGKSALKGLAGKITPEALALAERAKELGIPVNVAQLGDSKFLRTLASTLEQVPFTGAAKKTAEQKEAYTRAVASTFGEDVGKVTPEVYAAAKSRLGQQFDTLAARNELNVDGALSKKMNDILTNAEATAADDTIRAMKNVVGRVSEQAKTSGGRVPAQVSELVDAGGNRIVKAAASETPAVSKVPGATYSSIDTELSNMIKSGGEKGLYAKRLQAALREAMDSSISEADQVAWKSTRDQYRNLKAVRNVVAREMGDGDIPPTQLMNALNSTEAGKEAMAMGSRGTLGELGQIGRRFVRDTVPNSGTAQRAVAMGALGGGGLAFGADPTTIGGLMIGGATTGRILTKVLNDPKTVQALTAKGITLKELANMSPSRLTQVLGSLTGRVAADQLEE